MLCNLRPNGNVGEEKNVKKKTQMDLSATSRSYASYLFLALAHKASQSSLLLNSVLVMKSIAARSFASSSSLISCLTACSAVTAGRFSSLLGPSRGCGSSGTVGQAQGSDFGTDLRNSTWFGASLWLSPHGEHEISLRGLSLLAR